MPLRVEEANDALWLLEGLDEAIQKDAVKAAVVPTNAILVVFEERVHERPPLPQLQQGIALMGCALPSRGRMGYRGRSPWLVSRNAGAPLDRRRLRLT
jgi:hypothetical protein